MFYTNYSPHTLQQIQIFQGCCYTKYKNLGAESYLFKHMVEVMLLSTNNIAVVT
ncbi:hypothetical protein NC652_036127 [Populus alba x Populus x berolinensis]|nr:hypothetical protein NC652_036127 [Populus alba x Populus x berolinensis]